MSDMPDTPDTLQSDALDVAAIRRGIAGRLLGKRLVYIPAIGSTNTHAMELARAGATEGTLVTTDDQTAGRGRVGRIWKALPGQQLILSLILRPSFPPHLLVMASALAVAEAIAGVCAPPGVADTAGTPEVAIKWPNDVLVAGKKVCGILIETSEGIAILGMGLNVTGSLADDAELAARATTLADAYWRPISRTELAIELLQRLDARYASLQQGSVAAQHALRAAWRARLITLGRRVTIRQHAGQSETTLTGVAEDVDADGALLLRRDDGQRVVITWGDVE
ncbi:MAG: biotin--[acetyl-CoA-carboxylase] ligase [Ktedonobacterales bacterium]